MTLDTLTNRVTFTANGSTDAFATDFQFQDEEDLVVLTVDYTDPDAPVILTKVLNTHYTVTGGDGETGSVIFNDPPDADLKVVIYRNPAKDQDLDFVRGDNVDVDSLERKLDKITMISQRNGELASRSIRQSDGDTNTIDLTLPLGTPTANGIPILNADGDGFKPYADWPTSDDLENAEENADAAAASAAAAASSASDASDSADDSAASATAAASSASAASTSASAASTSASAASSSQTAAASSASAASTSASAASSSQTAAASSATAAAASASAASSSQTAAASSASAASSSQTAAASSATAAAASATSAATDAAATLFRWGGTSGGSANAQTLTPSPALGAYATGIRYSFLAGATNTTTTPTLAISGLTAKTMVRNDGTALVAGNITSGTEYTATYDGTNFRIQELISVPDGAISILKLDGSTISASDEMMNLALVASVSANALTVALKTKAGTNPSASDPVTVGFRNATLATGDYVRRQITGALSLVVSSGSTLGSVNGVGQYVYIYLIDNSGTPELAISGTPVFNDGTIQSTTAEGGAGAADSSVILYSTTARTSKAIRLIGRVYSTQATAGTWASSPTEIALTPFKTRALPTVQKFTSGSGTYTTPTGVTWIRVTMVGGGGGGGGSGTGSPTDGGTGGNSTFGSSLLEANGGSGGASAAGVGGSGAGRGGAGGSASLGSGPIGFAGTGSAGSPRVGLLGAGLNEAFSGMSGGSSMLGGNGRGGADGEAGGAGATNSGSGGGGAGGSNAGTGAVGQGAAGGGSGGGVSAIITSPSATYSYAVGSAGSAGSAGTSGFAGGAGGSGLIVVEEHYG